MEDNSQQVDWGIAAWMKCVKVDIIWKILHPMWTVLLQLEWGVFQRTLSRRYFTAGGELYCSMGEVCYSEHYLEDTSQHVNRRIAAWMECVIVNVMWNLLHSMWAGVLQLEWTVLHWTLSGRYFTSGVLFYYSFNEFGYIEHYLEDTYIYWTVVL